MKRIVIAGYHGYDNAGDDATLISMMNGIRKIEDLDTHIVVLSKTPKLTRKKYGVSACYRFNPFSVIYNILFSNTLVLGGGTLLQDSTSKRSIYYYLGLILLAKLFGKKVMLYSNGIGPIAGKMSRKITKILLNKVDLITLRENFAMAELASMGVSHQNIFITEDPAFGLGYMIGGKGKNILLLEGIPMDKRIVGVVIRECKNKEVYIVELAKICDYLIEKYDFHILFIPFQHEKDFHISDEVSNLMKNKSYVIKNKYDVDIIINVVKECSITICMRLHGVIFSAMTKVPVLGISYDPKVEHYVNKLEQILLGTNLDLDFEESIEKIDRIVKECDTIREKIEHKFFESEQNSIQNEKFLEKLIKK